MKVETDVEEIIPVGMLRLLPSLCRIFNKLGFIQIR